VANEILYSGLGDLAVSEILESQILLLLADRESYFTDPAVVYLGDQAGRGSSTGKVGLIGLDGYDLMASVSEGSAVSNTALTDASATCAVARQALQYEMSDLARAVDSTGMINYRRFAQSMVGSANMRLQDMLANIGDNFSSTVGTTTVDLTLDDFIDATITLDLASVPGPYLWMPHNRQYADFRNALLSVGGAVQFMSATAEQIALRGPGYKGEFLGVRIAQSTRVPTANGGADRASGMWGRGALGYKIASIPADPLIPAVYAGPIMIEVERNASAALGEIVGNLYAGVVEIEDSRGVTIITDA
jgi:hypothetical protein